MGDNEQRLVAVNIRVFKGNECLQSLDESQVIFLFRIITTAGPKLMMKDGAVVQGYLVKEEHDSLQVFPAVGLSTPISTLRLVCEVMKGVDPLNASTRARLRDYVCQYILSFFKFDLQSQPQPQPPRENPPRIIISVDAYVEESRNLAGESSASSEVAFPLHEQAENEEDEGDTEKRGDADQSSTGAIGYKIVLTVIPTREAQRRVTAAEMPEICRTLTALLKEKKLLGPQPIPVALLQEVEPAVTIQQINGVAPEDRCSICLEEISESAFAAKPPCSHVFHRGCLFAWLRSARSSTCPTCRGSCAATIC